KGVHPGFDSNPGAAWLDIRDRVAEAMPGADPEDRARIGGIVQAMRLRQTSLGRESLVVTDAPDRVVLKDADPDTPDRVSVDAAITELGTGRADLLHSHQTETALSLQDLRVLGNPRAGSILAVSPGGSIWRARPGKEIMAPHVRDFSARALDILADETLAVDDRRMLSLHALALYLERRDVIRYDFSVTGRMRDLFARFSSLIERLSS
ncbi:hypothetical protein, partial [Salipiger aestuarii]|uniref:hypothetical protein n=1 Tax=Salipiger aestuarii TaxID=568098 RepID=UPI001680F390